MKRFRVGLAAAVAAACLFFTGCLRHEEEATWWRSETGVPEESFSEIQMEQPVLITSFGQSADALMIKALLDNLDISAALNQTVSTQEIKDYRSVIIAVASSSKGLSLADISPEEELRRTQEIVSAIKDTSATVIVVNMGGGAHEESLTDELLQVALPVSNVIFTAPGGGKKAAEIYAKQHGIPFVEIGSVIDMATPIEELFSESK